MNERTQKQAELAALAQRFQLDSLYRALQSLEDHLDALESESDRHRDELARLDEKIAQLHAEAGLARPPGLTRPGSPARPGAQQLADDDVPDHPHPSPRQTSAARRRSTDPSTNRAPPDIAQDWDAYLRNVERYIADHAIEVTRDPLEQLLPPHRAADIRRRFATEFRPAPWDTLGLRRRRAGRARRRSHGLPARRDARRDLQGTASARKPADGMDEGTIEEAGSDVGPRRHRAQHVSTCGSPG